MRTFYLFCFSLLPILLLAQSSNKVYVSLGISQAHARFLTTEKYEIYSVNSSVRASSSLTRYSRAPGLTLGVSRLLHPRWELAARLNYTGATVQDTIRTLRFADYNLDISQLRERKYRAFSAEALLFWRLVGDHSLLDVQLGTGLAYLQIDQNYSSGFRYNEDTEVFTNYTTFENTHHLGIPVHLQAQYPLNYHFKIGAAIYVNAYFEDGRQQSGLSAFVAYRW